MRTFTKRSKCDKIENKQFLNNRENEEKKRGAKDEIPDWHTVFVLPKVQAAMKFVKANPGKKAIITSLAKAIDALEGKTGTVITFA